MKNELIKISDLRGKVILIDSSSLFDYGSAERFFRDTVPYDISIRIPISAASDVKLISDIEEFRKMNALLRKMLKKRRFRYIGNIGESSADTIVRYCMLRRMKVPLAVVTQDKRLFKDINKINTFRSSVGKEISIYYFAFEESREKFRKRVMDFCTEAEKMIRPNDY